jgi:hypothetical protein
MEGVLLTSIKNNITILVLGIIKLIQGASGCGYYYLILGAFRHDPVLESKLWNIVLNSYKGYFKEVLFAVLDKKDGDNIKAFVNEFKLYEESSNDD